MSTQLEFYFPALMPSSLCPLPISLQFSPPPLPQNQADSLNWCLSFYLARSCPLSASLPLWAPRCWCPPWCSPSPRLPHPKALRAGAWQHQTPSLLPAQPACSCLCQPQSQPWPAAPPSPSCSCRKHCYTSSRYGAQDCPTSLKILLPILTPAPCGCCVCLKGKWINKYMLEAACARGICNRLSLLTQLHFDSCFWFGVQER